MANTTSSCSRVTERVDVVALEGVDVAGQQLLVARRRPCAVRAASTSIAAERGPGPLERAVHRGHAWCRAARPPRWPASAAPRAGSAPPAAGAAGAGGRPRRPGGCVSRAAASSAGSPSVGSTRSSAMGWTHVLSGRPAAQQRSRPSTTAPGPSAGPGAAARGACRGRRWWRCGRATTAAPSGPRTGRCPARPAPWSPAPRPRPRSPSRASGSSSRSAPGGASRTRARWCPPRCPVRVAIAPW